MSYPSLLEVKLLELQVLDAQIVIAKAIYITLNRNKAIQCVLNAYDSIGMPCEFFKE